MKNERSKEFQRFLDVNFGNSYFRKFMGDSAEYVVQVKENEEKNIGDSIECTIHIPFEFCKTETYLPEQHLKLDKSNLSIDDVDKEIAKVLSVSPTSGKTIYSGKATNEDEITSDDTFSTAEIRNALNLASNFEKQEISPININGMSFYVMLVDECQAENLIKDSTWQVSNSGMYNFDVSNPIFDGALGICHNVVVHKCPFISAKRNKNGVTVRQALFLGAQSVLVGLGKIYYKRGNFIGRAIGIEKAYLNPKEKLKIDAGVVSVFTA